MKEGRINIGKRPLYKGYYFAKFLFLTYHEYGLEQG